MGIPVEYSFHENGPSQHEIDLRYTDALTMADNVMTFRLVAKEVAHDHGVYATFMPKPIAGAFGSGMHTHLSLFEGDVNAFHDPGRRVRPVEGREALHRRPARARERDRRDHEPVGQLVQAADPRLRSAGLQVLGAQQPLGARARAAARSGARTSRRRIEFRAPDPGVQPVPRVLGDARRRPQGHRRGLRPPARGDRQHLRADRRRAARRRHRRRCPVRCATRSTRWSARSWSPRRSASTCSRTSCSTSAGSGPSTRPYVTPFEIERYLGTL